MNKEFLNYLCEQRSLVQIDINKLDKMLKRPASSDEEALSVRHELRAELKIRKSQIETISEAIIKYLELHDIVIR